MRAWFKKQLSKVFALDEFCHDCGRDQPLVWSVPNEMWDEVMGGPAGVTCPECFEKRLWAKKRRILQWKGELL